MPLRILIQIYCNVLLINTIKTQPITVNFKSFTKQRTSRALFSPREQLLKKMIFYHHCFLLILKIKAYQVLFLIYPSFFKTLFSIIRDCKNFEFLRIVWLSLHIILLILDCSFTAAGERYPTAVCTPSLVSCYTCDQSKIVQHST